MQGLGLLGKTRIMVQAGPLPSNPVKKKHLCACISDFCSMMLGFCVCLFLLLRTISHLAAGAETFLYPPLVKVRGNESCKFYISSMTARFLEGEVRVQIFPGMIHCD